jgi:hypothetical protein
MRSNQDSRLHRACSFQQSPGQDSAIQSTFCGTRLANHICKKSQSHPERLPLDLQLGAWRRGADVGAQTCVTSTSRLRGAFLRYEKTSELNAMKQGQDSRA